MRKNWLRYFDYSIINFRNFSNFLPPQLQKFIRISCSNPPNRPPRLPDSQIKNHESLRVLVEAKTSKKIIKIINLSRIINHYNISDFFSTNWTIFDVFGALHTGNVVSAWLQQTISLIGPANCTRIWRNYFFSFYNTLINNFIHGWVAYFKDRFGNEGVQWRGFSLTRQPQPRSVSRSHIFEIKFIID